MGGFGVALILFCYCNSFLFQNSDKAVKNFTLVNFGIGFLMPLVNLIPYEGVKDTLLWILHHLYPFYPLQVKFTPIPSNPMTDTQ